MSTTNVNNKNIIIPERYRLSYNGFRFLVAVNGFTTKPRLSSDGQYVVGIRHILSEDDEIRTYTDREIFNFFLQDKHIFEDDVNLVFDSRFMNQNMGDAMLSFCVQVGNISNTELGKKIFRNPFDFQSLKPIFTSTYTNSKKSPNLVNRRRREFELYCSEFDPNTYRDLMSVSIDEIFPEET